MTPLKITVSYNVKRTHAYQAVDVGMEVEVEIQPGEKPQAVFEGVMRQIAPLVEREADAALRDILSAINS